MMTIEDIRAALADRNLREVARRSGISYRTLWALARGKTDPAYATVKAVSDYLQGERVAA